MQDSLPRTGLKKQNAGDAERKGTDKPIAPRSPQHLMTPWATKAKAKAKERASTEAKDPNGSQHRVGGIKPTQVRRGSNGRRGNPKGLAKAKGDSYPLWTSSTH